MNGRKYGLISIIIPTYNCANSIKKTIESVKKQTYENWEIIMVDDCSSDQTVEVLESLDDARIKIFKLTQNEGPAYARQIGIEKSNGMYITFMDSDDWYNTSTILEHMVDIFISNNGKIDCVMARYITLHKMYKLIKGREIHVGLYGNIEVRENKIITDSPMWHYLWNKMYLADAIVDKVRFEKEWRGKAEDVKFNRDYFKNSIGTYVIKECGYCYNCQGESLTRNKSSVGLNIDHIEKIISSYEKEFEYYMNEICELNKKEKLKKVIFERMFMKYLHILEMLKKTDQKKFLTEELYHTNAYKECVTELGGKRHILIGQHFLLLQKQKIKNFVKRVNNLCL